MNRRMVSGGALVGSGLLAVTCARRRGGSGLRTKLIERMPADAPRRRVLDNIIATRQNTDRILRLLESDPVSAPGEPDLAVGSSRRLP